MVCEEAGVEALIGKLVEWKLNPMHAPLPPSVLLQYALRFTSTYGFTS